MQWEMQLWRGHQYTLEVNLIRHAYVPMGDAALEGSSAGGSCWENQTMRTVMNPGSLIHTEQ